MKILHTTDLHFNKRWCEWINDQQPGYDAICITGDFLDSSKPEPLDTQMEWMSGWLRDFYKPVFVCSGNHDLEDWSGDGAYRDWETDRKSTRLNSSHRSLSRMPSSA